MTTKSVLLKTAELLGMTIDFTVDTSTVAALKSCFKYVLDELAGQYEDLRATETATADGGKIQYSALGHRVSRAISVRKGGRKVSFTVYPTHLSVKGEGEYEVTYTYIPVVGELDDPIVLPPKYDEEVLSLAVAAEYLHRTGYDTDAGFFFQRYYAALKNLAVVRKDIVLPARRFL